MARPSKLTPERQEIITEALRRGLYRETTARLAGIGVSTLYSWIERGQADRENDTPSCYRELVEAIENAEAVGESELVGMIREAAAKHWVAAAWMLERKMPEKYGRRDAVKVEHSGRIGHDVSGMSVEELERLAGELAG